MRSEDVGAGKRNDRWVEPFLDANRHSLQRLDLRAEVAYQGEVVLRLHPGPRIGAVPLVSPTTRKVAAGILIKPRLRWTHLGDVVGRIGFSVEPRIGGPALVPGSSREVPPWLLAGPVLRRLEALLRNRRRTFTDRRDVRSAPRGRILWNDYVSHSIATGHWYRLPCLFTEPDDDPELMANVRWTLARVSNSIQELAPTATGRRLLALAHTLELLIGAGPSKRPSITPPPSLATGILTDALEAIGWVSEERGLGGARSLDGLAWDLSVEAVWEQWVAHVMGDLAPQVGLRLLRDSEMKHPLHWRGSFRSMTSLIPDTGLRGRDRVVWVDAKYKAHLALLARMGWQGVSDEIRNAHRADLHQALAYASLARVDRIDTVLAYPATSTERTVASTSAMASIAAGHRRVRLFLVALPFGFQSPSHQEAAIKSLRDLLSN